MSIMVESLANKKKNTERAMTNRKKYNKEFDNKKRYPADVFGVKKIGVTTWLDEYFTPVTGKEYSIIYNNVVDIYMEKFCAQENNEPNYWLGVSNIKIASVMAHEIFNRLKIVRLKEAGYGSIIGKKEWKVNDFKLNKDIFNSLKYKTPSKKNRFKGYIKMGLYFFKSTFARLYKKRTMCYNFGYIPDNMNTYIYENNMVSGYFYPSFLLNNDRNFKHNDDLTYATKQFVLEVIEKYDFLNKDKEFFMKEIDEIFQQSSHYFEKNLKFIKKHKLGTLLAIGLGSPLHRTLIAAWRLSGQKVVGFSHGNNYALSVEDVYIEHDGLSITPELIVASQGHKLMLQELADEYRHNKKIKMARINFNRKSHYKGLFNQLQKKNAARRIKKIMLIGFPMNSFMYPGTPSNYSLSNLRLELNIAKCLKNYGYEVVYKAHPDRLNEVSGIFDGRVDEISTDLFEDVYDSVDCVIFGYSGTTTFGFCLLTNKPMVLINTEEIIWRFNTKSLLEKRCRIVNAEVNNNDEINFDELELKKAIDNSVNQIDYEIVHKYAF
jgi:hypothetical protein